MIVISIILSSYVTGPPAGVTNAPGESSCYLSPACHSGTANSGPGFGEITIMGGIPQGNLYVPGSTYVMMPYVVDTPMQKSGFQMVARLLNSNNAGVTTITQPNSTQKISGGGYDYAEQTQNGAHKPVMANMHDWMFDWQAPAQGSGTVIFYAAFVAANGNNSPTGDNIYTDTLVLYEDTTVDVPMIHDISAKPVVYPNPVEDNLYFKWETPLTNTVEISIYNSLGEKMQNTSTMPANTSEYKIDVQSLNPGIFFVLFQSGNHTAYLRKILKK